jgi:hypothetical protein
MVYCQILPLLAAGEGYRDHQTLAAHGLEELFSSCAVVSVFWLWREIVLGVTYLPYQLCCCVFFLVAVKNSFGLHRSVFCRVVSHLFTGSLAGIGKLSALAGWYIRYGMYGIFLL